MTTAGRHYSWRYVLAIFATHRRAIVLAHLVALMAAALAVPVPLMMPLLVDEVLLEQRGTLLAMLDTVLPAAWRGPTGYIVGVLVAMLLLRAVALGLQVWQARQFSLIAKDLIFQMRSELVLRLGRVSMSAYEALGASTISAHLVTDLNTIDEFTGATVSRLLIAVLSLAGAAGVPWK